MHKGGLLDTFPSECGWIQSRQIYCAMADRKGLLRKVFILFEAPIFSNFTLAT